MIFPKSGPLSQPVTFDAEDLETENALEINGEVKKISITPGEFQDEVLNMTITAPGESKTSLVSFLLCFVLVLLFVLHCLRLWLGAKGLYGEFYFESAALISHFRITLSFFSSQSESWRPSCTRPCFNREA